MAERVVLNFMQRMSGIATLTKVRRAIKFILRTFSTFYNVFSFIVHAELAF